jgi:ribose-phosphate pyrophosphokinase
MYVVVGQDEFANTIADSLNAEFIKYSSKQFADSESIIEIENPEIIKDKIAFVLFRFVPGSFNKQVLELLLLVHRIKKSGAKKIILVTPYLPYGRQAKSVDNTTDGPLDAIGLFLKSVGVDSMIACETHEQLCQDIFAVPLDNLTLEELWAPIVDKDFVILSPDKGGVERVNRLAKLSETKTAFIEKERVSYDKSVALTFTGDVKGKTVLLLDDIVDTGTTAVQAAQLAIKHGAKRVLACFTHAVLSKGAIELLDKSEIEKIWVTDTLILDKDKISNKIKIISIKDRLIEYVKGLL